jgi:glutaredoxin
MSTPVTVFSKDGCHLCEEVIETLSSLTSRYDLRVRIVDIDDDPKLHDRYWDTIPAVQIDGKVVFDARDMGGEVGYAVVLEQLLNSRGSGSVST